MGQEVRKDFAEWFESAPLVLAGAAGDGGPLLRLLLHSQVGALVLLAVFSLSTWLTSSRVSSWSLGFLLCGSFRVGHREAGFLGHVFPETRSGSCWFLNWQSHFSISQVKVSRNPPRFER